MWHMLCEAYLQSRIMSRRTIVSRFDSEAAVITGTGQLAVPAQLTRTGILIYSVDTPTGPIEWREYRSPAEVFDARSLATLRGAPVVEGHPAFINPDNWAQHARGHVADDVRPSGDYVASTLRVSHGDTLAKLSRKDLQEISCGYECDVRAEPGITPEGEPYDASQHNIRYNHVGLGPVNWGRAGAEARVFLDSAESDLGITHYDAGMMRNIRQARLDGRLFSPVAPVAPAPGGASAPNPPAPIPIRTDAAPAPIATAPAPLTHQIDVSALLASNAAMQRELETARARTTELEAAEAARTATESVIVADAQIEARAVALVTARADAATFGVEVAPGDTLLVLQQKTLAKLAPTEHARLTADTKATPAQWSTAYAIATDAYKTARAAAGGSTGRDGRVDSALDAQARTVNAADVSPIDAARARHDARFAGVKRAFGEALPAPAPATTPAK